MSLAKASMWTAISTLVKIAVGLLVVRILAVSYGPSGIGQAGNFRQLITVLGVLTGAGIFNGVTKYIAQYHQEQTELRRMIGTAAAIVMVFSLLLAAIFLLFAAPISHALFGYDRYQQVIRFVALLQVGIAWANLVLAIMRGFQDVMGNAIALIIGSLVGLAAWFICYWIGGYSGALVGLAMVPTLAVVPAVLVLACRKHLPMYYLMPFWQIEYVRGFSKFTLMALITAITLPVAWIMMRNLLALHSGWEQVGLWQGVSSISDAYLQFITASFNVYLLPTLAQLQNKADISREILKTLRFVLFLVAVVSCIVWLSRDFAIWLLFSQKFSKMRDLFVWQLIGDVLKVGCYIFGYIVIAKASLRFYILTEVSQFVLLTGFSRWLIPLHGAAGAAQAYMATYISWFALCTGAFIIYNRRV